MQSKKHSFGFQATSSCFLYTLWLVLQFLKTAKFESPFSPFFIGNYYLASSGNVAGLYKLPMKTVLPLEILNLDADGVHLLVDVGLGDLPPAKMVLDTGASKSVFDASWLGSQVNEISLQEYIRLSDEKGGRLQQRLQAFDASPEELVSASVNGDPVQFKYGILSSLRLGEGVLVGLPIVLMDLDRVNQLYESRLNCRFAGLLGSDLLLERKAVIDYRRKTLSLSFPSRRKGH